MSKVVFGKKVGKNEYCETPQDAFVFRLWSYNHNIHKAETNEEAMELDEKRANFLKTFTDELEDDVNLDDFLSSSLTIAHEKAMHHFKLAENVLYNGGTELAEEYLGHAKDYCSVVSSIQTLMTLNQDMGQNQ